MVWVKPQPLPLQGVTATNRSTGSKPMLTNSQSSNRAVLGASSEGYAEATLIQTPVAVANSRDWALSVEICTRGDQRRSNRGSHPHCPHFVDVVLENLLFAQLSA